MLPKLFAGPSLWGEERDRLLFFGQCVDKAFGLLTALKLGGAEEKAGSQG